MITNLKTIPKRILNKCWYIKKQTLVHLFWLPWQLRLYLLGHGQNFRIFTHLTLVEKLFLYKSALKLKPCSVIVEIGSYLGASTTFLAAAAMERDCMIYCGDTWKNDAMPGEPRDTFSEFKKNTKKFNNIVPLRGLSEDIGKSFSEKVDLLFIDGDHSYTAVKCDLTTWLPHTKNGTIVIFHDYGWAEGVKRAVEEIIKPIEIKGVGNFIESMYATIINGEAFAG